MVTTPLLESLRALSRTQKLYVMRFLVDELEKEEDLIKPGRSYPVWSPYDATDAAAKMLEVLRMEKDKSA